MDINGLDHIYITVSNLYQSEEFYDRVMALLGFFKGTDPVEGEPHIHYFNRNMQYTIRPARSGHGSYDPYSPGLHHLCFRVENEAVIDSIAKKLKAEGISFSGPACRTDYAPDYYSLFISDPDGIRLEIVNYTSVRRLIHERWDQFQEFENPMQSLREKE